MDVLIDLTFAMGIWRVGIITRPAAVWRVQPVRVGMFFFIMSGS